MKKYVALFIVAIMVFAMVACAAPTAEAPAVEPAETEAAPETAPEAAPETEAAAEEPLKIAFLIQHMNNEFMQDLTKYVEEAGAAAGVEVTSFSAEQDSSKQVSQVETCVNQGFDGIILDANGAEALVPAVLYAQEAGIPIITLHDDTTEGVSDAFVGVDFVQGASAKMQQCADDLGGKGKIAIMDGEMGSGAQIAIRSGYDPILEKYPDIEVVFEDTGSWTAEPAAKLMESWLASGKQIDAVVCNNDGMALGVISALIASNMQGKIKVYGLDAQQEMLKYVKEGTASASILTDCKGEGVAAIDTIVKLIKGEEVPKTQMIDMIVINAANVDQYLK